MTATPAIRVECDDELNRREAKENDLNSTARKYAGALGLMAVAALGLSACSMDGGSQDQMSESSSPAPESSSSMTSSESGEPMEPRATAT